MAIKPITGVCLLRSSPSHPQFFSPNKPLSQNCGKRRAARSQPQLPFRTAQFANHSPTKKERRRGKYKGLEEEERED